MNNAVIKLIVSFSGASFVAPFGSPCDFESMMHRRLHRRLEATVFRPVPRSPSHSSNNTVVPLAWSRVMSCGIALFVGLSHKLVEGVQFEVLGIEIPVAMAITFHVRHVQL